MRDRHHVSHRRAISRQTGPQEAGASVFTSISMAQGTWPPSQKKSDAAVWCCSPGTRRRAAALLWAPHHTPKAPESLTTGRNRDGLIKTWYLPWTQHQSILKELVFTEVSATQRESNQTLHYKMCTWLLPLLFGGVLFSLHMHACMRATIVSYCSILLNCTPTETQGKDTSATIAI